MSRMSGRQWCAWMLAGLVVSALAMFGCSKERSEEEAQQTAVEAGKAIGMKQAEMMKQGKMGVLKSGQ
ncbi:MAG: hypothetical protein KBA64_04890 [Armatimonadetes bacterium]|jgi:hypothetical protein|nr:hypothetical protein [Armatimonadota bacterium]MDI9603198.1 hypothetical protein [Acidobacteriota bacterium]NLN90410.1 hypothetical protein [candidate division WS1 bacterium]